MIEENMLRGSLASTQEAKGTLGFKGETGMSAYELAVKNGYQGTEQEWIEHFGLDLTGYLKTSDIVNNTFSGGTKKPLSAEAGKSLNMYVASIEANLGTLEFLDTDDKSSVVNAINEVLSDLVLLSNRDIYSDTETVIGVCDDKPLYRKKVSFTGAQMVTNAWTDAYSISNVGTLVKGLFGANDNSTIAVWNDVPVSYDNGKIRYFANMAHYTNFLIIEYTKTTD